VGQDLTVRRRQRICRPALAVNVVQAVMGHEQASTTLNLYTHLPADFHAQVRSALEGPADFR